MSSLESSAFARNSRQLTAKRSKNEENGESGDESPHSKVDDSQLFKKTGTTMTDTTKTTLTRLELVTRLTTGAGPAGIYRLAKLEQLGLGQVSRLPYSIRVLLEAVLRTCDGYQVTEEDVKNLAAWQAEAVAEIEIPFKPARVVLQDFTGVPAVVDLAAMRRAMRRLGGDPRKSTR